MKEAALVLLLCVSSAWAAPKDVRRVLAENGFAPGAPLRGPAMAWVEDAVGFRPPINYFPDAPPRKPVILAQYEYPWAGARVLSDAQAHQLAALLADRKTYSPALGGKLCVFHTDIEVRIPGADGEITIEFCFGCNQVLLSQKGWPIAEADINRGRGQIVRWVKEIFPHEWKVQRLQNAAAFMPSPKLVMEWAETMIPDDPLFKSLAGKNLSEISEEDLEELDDRCTAKEYEWSEKEAAERVKSP